MTGLIVGKFMPPHKGHLHLIEQALQHVDALTVIVLSLSREPIPGSRRVEWLEELVGDRVELLHIEDRYPTDYADPAVWDKWVETIRSVYPKGPDLVFSSEEYGYQLADLLGARHVMVDEHRRSVPISATQIRRDPMAHWRFIPEPVRPWFVRRIVVAGPTRQRRRELACDLARRLETACVAGVVEDYAAAKGAPLTWHDLPGLVRGQRAREESAARQANRLIVSEDVRLAMALWAEYHFSDVPPEVAPREGARRYDLALLVGCERCPERDDPNRHAWLCGGYRSRLPAMARRVEELGGDGDPLGQACRLAEELIARLAE